MQPLMDILTDYCELSIHNVFPLVWLTGQSLWAQRSVWPMAEGRPWEVFVREVREKRDGSHGQQFEVPETSNLER